LGDKLYAIVGLEAAKVYGLSNVSSLPMDGFGGIIVNTCVGPVLVATAPRENGAAPAGEFQLLRPASFGLSLASIVVACGCSQHSLLLRLTSLTFGESILTQWLNGTVIHPCDIDLNLFALCIQNGLLQVIRAVGQARELN
jgi:hypothetical protein